VTSATIDDRREIFGWKMYAWASHGFVTTVASVLIGPYLTDLAQRAVGENGRVFARHFLSTVTAKAFYPYCVSLSVFLQLFLLPVLGAVAFLPDIASPGQRDRISSRGYALGYLGGAVHLLASLTLIRFAKDLGLPTDLAVRLALGSAGLWWLGFASVTFRRLLTRSAAHQPPADRTYLGRAVSQVKQMVRELAHLPTPAGFSPPICSSTTGSRP